MKEWLSASYFPGARLPSVGGTVNTAPIPPASTSCLGLEREGILYSNVIKIHHMVIP